METFAEWVLTAEMALGQRVADQRRLWRSNRVTLIEAAATEHVNAHRLAVVRADRVTKYIVAGLGIFILELRTVGVAYRWIVAERQQTRECRLLHTRNPPHRVERLLKEPAPPAAAHARRRGEVVKLMPEGLYLHSEEVRGIEPGVNRQQASHAAHEQSGADQQN